MLVIEKRILIHATAHSIFNVITDPQ